MPRIVPFLAFLLAAGCTSAGTVGSDGVTRSQRGDTIVVTTRGPGVWGPLRDAVEVKRITDESPQTTFGQVFTVVATRDGGVLVFDVKAPEGAILRQFDAEGMFVRNIGRQGGGPGEYSLIGQVVFATAPDGTIILRDGRRMVNRYARDGTFLDGFAHGYASTLELYPGADGSVIMRGPFKPGGGANPFALPPLIHHAADGRILDTIADPAPWLTTVAVTQYDARSYWFPYPDGRIFQFRSDILGFLLADPAGTTPPVIGEAKAPPLPYFDEERAELAQVDAWQLQRADPEMRSAIGRVPRNKFPVKSFGFSDIDGRIWLWRSAAAHKTEPRVVARAGQDSIMVTYDEPRVFAAFDPDGTFLGEVRFPVGVLPSFAGNTAWGIVTGENGEPVLVKYRIHD